MKTPEEQRTEDRRRRTERQRELRERARELRERARICGHCREPATAGLIEWSGRGGDLLIPICRSCLARLGACWRDMDEVGPWCHVDEQRPCPDCAVASPAEKSERGLFRRLFSG